MATTNDNTIPQLVIDAVNSRKVSLAKNKYTKENPYKAPTDDLNVGQISIH